MSYDDFERAMLNLVDAWVEPPSLEVCSHSSWAKERLQRVVATRETPLFCVLLCRQCRSLFSS